MNDLYSNFPPNLDGFYTEELANQLANTHGAISSLNQLDRLLHNPNLLMHPILGKEAESSSQLEGTQASIADAYKIDVLDQSPEERNEAVEIRNYENAMYDGIKLIKRFPLNAFVIREIHKTLLAEGRGKSKHPGLFRKDDVWIGTIGTKKGDARYVAPDALQVEPLLEQLADYLDNSGLTHPLIVCGIMHHRFEAIHPFEDGNGRTGRLLISLYLIKKGLLSLPILYPSGYFDAYKTEYMNALSAVDREGHWYEWLLFFLKGLEEQAKLSLQLGLQIDSLYKAGKDKIHTQKAGLQLMNVLEFMFTRYFVTAPIVYKYTRIPLTSCKRYLATLAELNVIEDLGIHGKQRVYANAKLLDLLQRI